MQQQTNKKSTSKNKRLKNIIICEPQRIKHLHRKDENFVCHKNKITLDNNFIFAFNEYKKLKNKGFNLIMFDNIIFHTTSVKEIFNNYKLII